MGSRHLLQLCTDVILTSVLPINSMSIPDASPWQNFEPNL
uniref:Uncharacterized protein n=1 Tax=Anguilla anguilla TaxID=7936 RepID=A0A0E9VE19_ANGAN